MYNVLRTTLLYKIIRNDNITDFHNIVCAHITAYNVLWYALIHVQSVQTSWKTECLYFIFSPDRPTYEP